MCRIYVPMDISIRRVFLELERVERTHVTRAAGRSGTDSPRGPR